MDCYQVDVKNMIRLYEKGAICVFSSGSNSSTAVYPQQFLVLDDDQESKSIAATEIHDNREAQQQ